MIAPLDEQYLTWLYAEVAPVRLRSPSRTYWSLLRQLYQKEFVWLIPNDDNRVEDGKDLRGQFLQEQGIYDPEMNWLELGCSVLEMLVALCRRLEFETGMGKDYWFWHLMENLKLNKINDAAYEEDGRRTERYVNDILERLVWRLYDHNGRGGLFPLDRPNKDQRYVEIWYQLNAYLLERD